MAKSQRPAPTSQVHFFVVVVVDVVATAVAAASAAVLLLLFLLSFVLLFCCFVICCCCCFGELFCNSHAVRKNVTFNNTILAYATFRCKPLFRGAKRL